MLGPGEKRTVDPNSDKKGNHRTFELFKKRWFVLGMWLVTYLLLCLLSSSLTHSYMTITIIDEASKTFKYYPNEKSRAELGCIDMTTVIDIQACTDPDAPPYAIDLVGRGGRCSIAGE